MFQYKNATQSTVKYLLVTLDAHSLDVCQAQKPSFLDQGADIFSIMDSSQSDVEDNAEHLRQEIGSLHSSIKDKSTLDKAASNEMVLKSLLIKATRYLAAHPFSKDIYESGLFGSSLLPLPQPASHSLANVLYLQAQLLRHSPEGPVASGCIAKLEEAVNAGVLANPNATTKRKPQLKREKELREVRKEMDIFALHRNATHQHGPTATRFAHRSQMKIAAGIVNVEEEERLEKEAREVKEERSAHHKRRKVRKLESKIISLASLEADVSDLMSTYTTPQLCGSCTTVPSRVDWSVVPNILQPSAEEEGGGGIKDSERAGRKMSQLEVRPRGKHFSVAYILLTTRFACRYHASPSGSYLIL